MSSKCVYVTYVIEIHLWLYASNNVFNIKSTVLIKKIAIRQDAYAFAFIDRTLNRS